jgi:hypothetical protein
MDGQSWPSKTTQNHRNSTTIRHHPHTLEKSYGFFLMMGGINFTIGKTPST